MKPHWIYPYLLLVLLLQQLPLSGNNYQPIKCLDGDLYPLHFNSICIGDNGILYGVNAAGLYQKTNSGWDLMYKMTGLSHLHPLENGFMTLDQNGLVFFTQDELGKLFPKKIHLDVDLRKIKEVLYIGNRLYIILDKKIIEYKDGNTSIIECTDEIAQVTVHLNKLLILSKKNRFYLQVGHFLKSIGIRPHSPIDEVIGIASQQGNILCFHKNGWTVYQDEKQAIYRNGFDWDPIAVLCKAKSSIVFRTTSGTYYQLNEDGTTTVLDQNSEKKHVENLHRFGRSGFIALDKTNNEVILLGEANEVLLNLEVDATSIIFGEKTQQYIIKNGKLHLNTKTAPIPSPMPLQGDHFTPLSNGFVWHFRDSIFHFNSTSHTFSAITSSEHLSGLNADPADRQNFYSLEGGSLYLHHWDGLTYNKGLEDNNKQNFALVDGVLYQRQHENIAGRPIERQKENTSLRYDWHWISKNKKNILIKSSNQYWINNPSDKKILKKVPYDIGAMLSPFTEIQDFLFTSDSLMLVAKIPNSDFHLCLILLCNKPEKMIWRSMDRYLNPSIVRWDSGFALLSNKGLIQPDFTLKESETPKAYFSSIVWGNNRILLQGQAAYKKTKFPFMQDISLMFSNQESFLPHKSIYRYKIKNQIDQWSPWSQKDQLDIRLSKPGKITIEIETINPTGILSESTSLTLFVSPPWYKTYLAYLFYILLLCASLYLLMGLYSLKLSAMNKRLQKIIGERTEEIIKSKEELQRKNFDINASIEYARTIQEAILTSTEYLSIILPESFVFYRPRDIVSGDFYWAYQTISGKVILAVSDCTGHGVPGALMSMIGNSILNEIVIENQIEQPEVILEKLREGIINSFHGASKKPEDGMDISVVSLDPKNLKMIFAGARSNIYHISNEQLTVYNGEDFGIKSAPTGITPFKSHPVQLKQGDSIYLFTDGFADQFGGEYGKKLKYQKFRKLLSDTNHLDKNKQKEEIELFFDAWKKGYDQLDDICILGFKV